ncbi:MAG: dimethyl sulfoxide reductase anchor subunit [Acidobacteria bacterium]|nr:dimethyl sulfoxide reductase anchor subunit [Acidobacteriota bacterium]
MSAAFVLEASRCTGCEACRVACCIENQVPMERAWRTVHHHEGDAGAVGKGFHLSLACNHCERPACLAACPSGAYRQDPRTGAVLLDQDTCLGCRCCSWACPYDAPRFDGTLGLMAKCTFCNPRLLEGLAPACAAACPTGALRVDPQAGALPEPEAPGLFPAGIGPRLWLVGPIQGPAPEGLPPLTHEALAWMGGPTPPLPRIHLRREWSLVLFSSFAPLLVALQAAFLSGGPAQAPPWAFLGLGLLAGFLSTAHLGRPLRALRALGNLRRSWLSREILAFAIFVPLGALSQFLASRTLGAVAGVAGLGLLFCMDRLYRSLEWRAGPAEKADDTLFGGITLALFALGLPGWLLLGAAVARSFAFLREQKQAGTQALSGGLALLRVLLLALPALAVVLRQPWPPALLLSLAAGGELVGRGAFYLALRIPDPGALLKDVRPAAWDPAGT